MLLLQKSDLKAKCLRFNFSRGRNQKNQKETLHVSRGYPFLLLFVLPLTVNSEPQPGSLPDIHSALHPGSAAVWRRSSIHHCDLWLSLQPVCPSNSSKRSLHCSPYKTSHEFHHAAHHGCFWSLIPAEYRFTTKTPLGLSPGRPAEGLRSYQRKDYV